MVGRCGAGFGLRFAPRPVMEAELGPQGVAGTGSSTCLGAPVQGHGQAGHPAEGEKGVVGEGARWSHCAAL